jgi:polar amino acid transport system substrate-binding protein
MKHVGPGAGESSITPQHQAAGGGCLMRLALARIKIAYFFAVLILSLLAHQEIALSQTCGIDYVIKEGESLADIATRVYGNASQWTLIFYANQDRIGASTQLLSPGQSIRVPCVASPSSQPALPASLEAAQTPPMAGDDMEISPTVRRIEFLTADGFAPFTDRALPNGGMITQIVTTAMDLIKERSGGSFSYRISWVNDWSAHLSTLLVTRAFDVGFPWGKPDCNSGADLSKDAKYRCQRFFFSDPVYEVFTVLFVQSGSTLNFVKDDEIIGKSICQPANQSTYELDKGGRNWVKDNKVVLVKPQSLEECFRLLDGGSVNAVVTPDLSGKAAISALGLEKRVKALPRPVDIGTLHLIVPKTHPQASTIIYYLNAAIARLRENGDYDRIIDTHLSRFWIAAEHK